MSAEGLLVVALVVLFALAVVLGAAEAALLRVPLVRVVLAAEEGDRRAAVLERLVGDLPVVLNTVLLAVLLVQIGAATVSGVLAGRWFGTVGVTITSVVLTILLFVYAEAIPKTYAVHHPLRVAGATVPLVRSLVFVLGPVVRLLVAFADFQVRGGNGSVSAGLTEPELRRLAAEAADEGRIDESDVEFLERAFEIGDLRIQRILVPRTDVVAIDASATVGEALDVAVAAGHRRLPVHEGSLDSIFGFVRLKDLAGARDDDATVRDLVVPMEAVPESKPAVDLLREMQRSGTHMAVAVDEFGGVEGIVTIEDVVAELVGEVADEGEFRSRPVRPAGRNRWLVSADADVTDVEEVLGTRLPVGEWRTVGGMLSGTSGRILEPGDVVECGGFRFRVLAASGPRVDLVEVSA